MSKILCEVVGRSLNSPEFKNSYVASPWRPTEIYQPVYEETRRRLVLDKNKGLIEMEYHKMQGYVVTYNEEGEVLYTDEVVKEDNWKQLAGHEVYEDEVIVATRWLNTIHTTSEPEKWGNTKRYLDTLHGDCVEHLKEILEVDIVAKAIMEGVEYKTGAGSR